MAKRVKSIGRSMGYSYNHTQKPGFGRVKGVLNYKTLSERKAWIDACISEEFNPFLATTQIAKEMHEMFIQARDAGDHKSAGAWMQLLDATLARMHSGLIPKNAVEEDNNNIIDLLPQIKLHPDIDKQ